MSNVEEAQSKLLDCCAALTEHANLLRDYATTPGNVWLARSELHRIQELTAELEQLLAIIKAGS